MIAAAWSEFLPGGRRGTASGCRPAARSWSAPVLGALLLAGYAALSMGVGTQRLVRGDIS